MVLTEELLFSDVPGHFGNEVGVYPCPLLPALGPLPLHWRDFLSPASNLLQLPAHPGCPGPRSRLCALDTCVALWRENRTSEGQGAPRVVVVARETGT